MATQTLQGMRDLMAKKIPVFYMEYPCHGSAQQRWFGMRVMKLESDDQMIVVAHQNITERKLAEKYLFQSEARLTEAQAISNIGNFELDMGNYLEVWSDEMFKIFGINKAEFTASRELFCHSSTLMTLIMSKQQWMNV
jgi:PAS domain-containing protein